MNIDKIRLDHLQSLSKLHINDTEEFSRKLNVVVNYIENISSFENTNNTANTKIDHHIHPLNTVTNTNNNQLLENVEHEKLNNSIVVKSVLH